jgi:hypothetical protein
MKHDFGLTDDEIRRLLNEIGLGVESSIQPVTQEEAQQIEAEYEASKDLHVGTPEMDQRHHEALQDMLMMAKVSRLEISDWQFVLIVRAMSELGYGRMMQIISYEWRRSAEQKGYPAEGALVSALLSDLPEDHQRNYLTGYRDHLKRFSKQRDAAAQNRERVEE